jgi:tRNA pseudouridine(38-40) synthase
VKIRSVYPASISPDCIPRHPNDFSSNESPAQEIDYASLINKALPEEIRILGWCEVTPGFSARFSASYRMYRYFFVKRNLDIDLMKQAASDLLGSHDFRNFCKLDVENVTNFVREIYSVEIRPALNAVELTADTSDSRDDSSTVYVMEIKGIAFLWHMVRCIMAILFLVGEGRENPEIVKKLLDITATPAKPQYTIAADLPLVLHDCGFENLSIQWQPRALWSLSLHFQQLMNRHLIAVAQAKNALDALKDKSVRTADVPLFFDQLIAYHKLDKAWKINISATSVMVSESAAATDDKESTMIMWKEALDWIGASGLQLSDDLSAYKPLLEVSVLYRHSRNHSLYLQCMYLS